MRRILSIAVIAMMAAAAAADVYLSDVADTLVTRQGWGKLGVDTAAAPSGDAAGQPLRIGEKTYERGIGHHAPGEIVVSLDGAYRRFTAELGVQWQGGDRGSVVFEIQVDGETRFTGESMSDSTAPVPVDIDLTDARELRLIAGDAGDGITCDMANWADARLVGDPTVPTFGAPEIVLAGRPAPRPSSPATGFALVASEDGPQVALLAPPFALVACLDAREDVVVTIPLEGFPQPFSVSAEATLMHGGDAEAILTVGEGSVARATLVEGRARLEAAGAPGEDRIEIRLRARAASGEAVVRWSAVRFQTANRTLDIPLMAHTAESLELYPPAQTAPMRPAMERALIEWDWRMQDGLGTPRVPVTFASAIEKTFERGDALLAELERLGVAPAAEKRAWEALRREFAAVKARNLADDHSAWEDLWRRTHGTRRDIVFANPLADTGPLLFVKHAPGSFSHQLTQYYGRYARPGGGVFVLDAPGRSMRCAELAPGQLPAGSFMHPEVTHDADRILFAFVEAPTVPSDGFKGEQGRYFHLYEMKPDGSGLRRLTDGPFDDFAPRELPDGRIVFISTRRGGWHRCGTPGCEVYTLALAEPDGSNPRSISYHETQEWDPAVLYDGRIVYTRWDYVDRNAVHYQQLWSTRPDGSAPVIYYGNNTFNPVGVWEPRPVPGTELVMATAAAHHAMTAGSIILVDVTRGVDGLDPITRLTPDALFPEGEALLLPYWRAAAPAEPPFVLPEAERWPGHCYRSPYPLSETFFLAAYSFDPLIGEPHGNPANMFGLYMMDRFGNKELLYRDPNISALWPTPLRPRPRPPIIPAVIDPDYEERNEGVFFLRNVYDSDPALPPGTITSLRIVQVLPKSTPGANNPMVGFANASPGKQVLGTVPVEADGSAYFRAPARIPLSFQALDELGRAVQIMRSLTYLQPGERASCVGCHEPRLAAPAPADTPIAARREPSEITPGPDGSLPLSFPILVQPVLEKHCVGCHGKEKPAGPEGQPVVLTGEPEQRYTVAYNTLGPRVMYTAWGRPGGFPEGNSEPVTQPGFFGARGSRLMDMLLEGHHDVVLDDDDLDRLVTWMDANALFYGTFFPEEQARQQRGERIEGPGLE